MVRALEDTVRNKYQHQLRIDTGRVGPSPSLPCPVFDIDREVGFLGQTWWSL